MTTVILRPDATRDAGTVVGAASTHAALNDNSDASYVGTTTAFSVYLGTSVLPAGSITKQCRVRARHADYTGFKTISLKTTDITLATLSVGGDTTTVVDESGAYAPQTLTQTQVDAFEISVACDTAASRTHELYADLVYVAKPVTVVSAVTPDPYTASNWVPISWTSTLDGDGGAQTHVEMRVFSAAQYGIGGFDPLTSPATYQTGQLATTVLTLFAPALPNSTTYRAYVRVGQTVNGVQHWSAMAFDQFAVEVTTSDVTSVTTVASNTTGSIAVTVNRTAISSAWDYVEVQRSIDAGVTWSNVRGATYVDPPLADSFVITDYEVPNGTSVTYRARATRIVSGLQITGAWTSSSSTSWTSTSTFLKVPGTPTLNISTLCLVSRTPYQRSRRTGVFQVLGKATPVTVSDVRSSRSGRLDLETTTTAEAAALNNMLNGASVILVQFPAVMDIADTYAAITEDANVFDAMVANVVRRTWSLDYVEVDAPADPLAGA